MKQQQEVGTIVGSSVHLTGSIKDSSDIVIFGSVDGEVSSEQKIVIEESARVKGPITGQEIMISGVVSGTVVAKERLEISPTGSVKGNIDTKDLLIHSGASFVGKCNMPEKKIDGSAAMKEDFEAEVDTEDIEGAPEEKRVVREKDEVDVEEE